MVTDALQAAPTPLRPRPGLQPAKALAAGGTACSRRLPRLSCANSCPPPANVSANRFRGPSRVASVDARASSRWLHSRLPGGSSLTPTGALPDGGSA